MNRPTHPGPIQVFLERFTEIAPGAHVEAQALHAAYLAWAAQHHIPTRPQAAPFNAAVRRNFAGAAPIVAFATAANGRKRWLGLRLNEAPKPAEPFTAKRIAGGVCSGGSVHLDLYDAEGKVGAQAIMPIATFLELSDEVHAAADEFYRRRDAGTLPSVGHC